MSRITTHVLDTSGGVPARGVAVTLYRRHDDRWRELGAGATNEDGRVVDLLDAAAAPAAGVYKLRFNTGAYYEKQGSRTFYPFVEVVFTIAEGGGHYHVPLLLSPFGYSTYRGS